MHHIATQRFIQHRYFMSISCASLSQEVHYPDGTVMIDGKRLLQTQLEEYRANSSSRMRSRTRGGALVRSREPCRNVQGSFGFRVSFCMIVYTQTYRYVERQVVTAYMSYFYNAHLFTCFHMHIT